MPLKASAAKVGKTISQTPKDNSVEQQLTKLHNNNSHSLFIVLNKMHEKEFQKVCYFNLIICECHVYLIMQILKRIKNKHIAHLFQLPASAIKWMNLILGNCLIEYFRFCF